MTKKLLYLTSANLLFLTAVSVAQPTLSATGVNPIIGDNYTLMGRPM